MAVAVKEKPFHHTLSVQKERCQSCTRCMKRCPTLAIRIDKGSAHVDPERCIDCGQCMAACPHHAIHVEQSSFDQLFKYKWRVAVFPTILFAQFEDETTEDSICQALRDIGFTHLYLAELGVDILGTLGKRISRYADAVPIISTFCPAVNRLMQISYPSLLRNLNQLRTPAQITAMFARAELQDEGKQPEDIGVFYITPCPAKMAQIKTPGSADHKLFQGVLNMDSAYNMVKASLVKNKGKEPQQSSWLSFPVITDVAARWSLTKGESTNMTGRSLAVDEIHQVIEFLEEVERDDEQNLDFLELKACAQGCVGGILTVRNRFLASERMTHWASQRPQKLPPELQQRILSHTDSFIKHLKADRIEPKSTLKLDKDISRAIQKMERITRIFAVLPGIDCGLCGAPSCKALAEDIARAEASLKKCAVLKLKDPKELNTLSRIWGEKIPKKEIADDSNSKEHSKN